MNSATASSFSSPTPPRGPFAPDCQSGGLPGVFPSDSPAAARIANTTMAARHCQSGAAATAEPGAKKKHQKTAPLNKAACLALDAARLLVPGLAGLAGFRG